MSIPETRVRSLPRTGSVKSLIKYVTSSGYETTHPLIQSSEDPRPSDRGVRDGFWNYCRFVIRV